MGHLPRDAAIKGSETINRVCREYSAKHDFHYFYSSWRVPWEQNIERMARCDVYIAACKPVLYGKLYGGGIEITDLEAAALGLIVITHFTNSDLYEKEYGRHELLVANNEEQLRSCLDTVVAMTKEQRAEKMAATRTWVETYHSYEAVGNKLKGLLFC